MTVDANVCFLHPGNPIFSALAAMHKVPENWVEAFTSALDIGFENSRGEYFIIMHSDTIVKHPGWVERLLSPFEATPSALRQARGSWNGNTPCTSSQRD
ncbi:MAG: glycosyltransferase [Planctomycetota bacterium]